jgi:hypothetical protein
MDLLTKSDSGPTLTKMDRSLLSTANGRTVGIGQEVKTVKVTATFSSALRANHQANKLMFWYGNGLTVHCPKASSEITFAAIMLACDSYISKLLHERQISYVAIPSARATRLKRFAQADIRTIESISMELASVQNVRESKNSLAISPIHTDKGGNNVPPCDSITLAQVHLGLANKDILEQTLKTLADGGKVRRDHNDFTFFRNGDKYRIISDGQLVCSAGLEGMADVIKRAYSGQVVKAAAKKFGWDLKAKTPEKLTVRKRF